MCTIKKKTYAKQHKRNDSYLSRAFDKFRTEIKLFVQNPFIKVSSDITLKIAKEK